MDVLLDAHLGVQRDAFGEIADILAHAGRFQHHVIAGDAGHAAGRGEIAGEDAHGRRFALAVQAEETDDFAPPDREGEAVHRHDGAKVFAEVFYLNHFRS